jgi:hypothetical protein
MCFYNEKNLLTLYYFCYGCEFVSNGSVDQSYIPDICCFGPKPHCIRLHITKGEFFREHVTSSCLIYLKFIQLTNACLILNFGIHNYVSII